MERILGHCQDKELACSLLLCQEPHPDCSLSPSGKRHQRFRKPTNGPTPVEENQPWLTLLHQRFSTFLLPTITYMVFSMALVMSFPGHFSGFCSSISRAAGCWEKFSGLNKAFVPQGGGAYCATTHCKTALHSAMSAQKSGHPECWGNRTWKWLARVHPLQMFAPPQSRLAYKANASILLKSMALAHQRLVNQSSTPSKIATCVLLSGGVLLAFFWGVGFFTCLAPGSGNPCYATA